MSDTPRPALQPPQVLAGAIARHLEEENLILSEDRPLTQDIIGQHIARNEAESRPSADAPPPPHDPDWEDCQACVIADGEPCLFHQGVICANKARESEIAEVRKQHDCGCDVCSTVSTVCPASASSYAMEILALRAEITRLREALDRFGDHSLSCVSHDKKTCDCGFDEALAGGIAPPSAWIPVSERLPEKNHRVFVYAPTYGRHVAMYEGQQCFTVQLPNAVNDEWSLTDGEVTHWQPLPAPPSPPPTEPIL